MSRARRQRADCATLERNLGFETICAAILLAFVLAKRMRERREMERHGITSEALHALLASKQEVLVIDARLPLDLLGDSVIIPGAMRLARRRCWRIHRSFPKRKTWSFTTVHFDFRESSFDLMKIPRG